MRSILIVRVEAEFDIDSDTCLYYWTVVNKSESVLPRSIIHLFGILSGPLSRVHASVRNGEDGD